MFVLTLNLDLHMHSSVCCYKAFVCWFSSSLKKKKSSSHAHNASTIFWVLISWKWIRSIEIFLKQFDVRLLQFLPPPKYFMVVLSIINFNKEFLIPATFINFFPRIQFSFHRNSNFFNTQIAQDCRLFHQMTCILLTALEGSCLPVTVQCLTWIH